MPRPNAQLTEACNSCHLGARQVPIVIQEPKESTFPDQDFPPEALRELKARRKAAHAFARFKKSLQVNGSKAATFCVTAASKGRHTFWQGQIAPSARHRWQPAALLL